MPKTVAHFSYVGRRNPVVTDSGNHEDIHLTVMDFVATALIFVSIASGPGLMWLVLHTAA